MTRAWQPPTAALRRTLAAALKCGLLAQGRCGASADEAPWLGLAAGSALFWRRVRFSHAGRVLPIGHTLATLARTPVLRRLGGRPVLVVEHFLPPMLHLEAPSCS